ncbi:hypothetical protein B6D17_10030 [Gilliamella apis]|uniref:hypothetical protein n=1 Tax=Gilliamella apis TaxID=1970738 RepID=UPI000A33F025|nr:hypothetical protein [Gilliamella apis]OTQ69725.1 hypothetical protein B6D17_10030 [Gilliamella apis]OTQ74312.1 hypothetical protein B6C90_08540 [Gilliamella apis]
MVLVLTVVVLQSISFANYALTTTTTNIIYGSAPYLTFDGGRTRVTNTEALLGISLSDGRKFTPATNNSRDNPIILPVDGQSFNDIGMLVPTDTDSIALSSLIGTPYNYWGDDDGDGQGIDGVTATGSLNLSIVDRFSRAVARNKVLDICNAPYRLTLSNSEGILKTRYGVPNESRFTAGNATYYINPKGAPVICYARPASHLGSSDNWSKGLSAAVWVPSWGFVPQSVTPSSYGLNFPTTGANNLYFDLDIGGGSQALSWAPVSHGGITATMYDSTRGGVRVTLKGPVARGFTNPGRVNRPSLPQTFELVGRDSSGNAVVKYGFVLKQWFIASYTSKTIAISFDDALSWCNKTGYHLPKVSDLTNGSCPGCQGAVGATPSSPDRYLRRHIGAGFFSEWGLMSDYGSGNFNPYLNGYYSSELTSDGVKVFTARFPDGLWGSSRKMNTYPAHIGYGMLCTSP